MTISFFTATNSVVATSGAGRYIGAGETVNILNGGYLVSSDSTSKGFGINGDTSSVLPTHINVAGAVWGAQNGIYYYDTLSTYLDITIAATGSVGSNREAIILSDTQHITVNLINAGNITSGFGGSAQPAIAAYNAAFYLENSGTISTFGGPAILVAGGSVLAQLHNSGEIDGDISISATNAIVVDFQNTHLITGNVTITNATNTHLTNHGTIAGDIVVSMIASFGVSADLSGGQTGKFEMISDGYSTLDMTGAIVHGDVDIQSNSVVQFNGFVGAQISGYLSLGNAETFADISGVSVQAGVYSGLHNDVITFHSGVDHGDLMTSFGDDVLDMTGGQVFGQIDLGDGNDLMTGSDFIEHVTDGLGDDSYDLGGGNDVFALAAISSAGNDSVDAGTGVDTLDLSNISSVSASYTKTTGSVFVSLEEGLLHGAPANTSNLFGIDTVLNFENVIGGEFNDQITGSGADNKILGGAGDDTLVGQSGNDVLRGGTGNDLIEGDRGRDMMHGGDGADTFVFLTAVDSGITRATRDVIFDFTQGSDKISLAAVDANSVTAGVQHFTFAGHTSISATGSIRYLFEHGDTVIQANTGGTNSAEFTILLIGTVDLTAADFTFV